MTASKTRSDAHPSGDGGFDLDGKVAIVTGAVGLLGREHCRALARAGARLVATDLDLSSVRAFAGCLSDEFGREALGLAADVTLPASLDALRAAVLERFGRIDVLVNNAAIDDKYAGSGGAGARFEDYPIEHFRRMLDVNVTGVFSCCQRLGSVMAARGAGSIINVASTYGVVAPNQDLYRLSDGSQSFYKSAAYPTSKGAVLQLTRFLAAYYGERGVRVNALSPGGVDSGQDSHFRARYAARTPLGRMARASDYQGALVFLASDASAYMTGANLVVDGGFTIW
jgi:NAD(P)-dependent dehydrogenase (short-subunit alcohol dehydrogenase family)